MRLHTLYWVDFLMHILVSDGDFPELSAEARSVNAKIWHELDRLVGIISATAVVEGVLVGRTAVIQLLSAV